MNKMAIPGALIASYRISAGWPLLKILDSGTRDDWTGAQCVVMFGEYASKA